MAYVIIEYFKNAITIQNFRRAQSGKNVPNLTTTQEISYTLHSKVFLGSFYFFGNRRKARIERMVEVRETKAFCFLNKFTLPWI